MATENEITTRDLMDSDTGEYIGLATQAQADASDAAGAEGHIRIVRATGKVVREDDQSAYYPADLRRVYVDPA